MKTYRNLLKWHKRIGITAALFVILLAATGLALNHTERLELDQKFIGSSTLLDLYNISLPDNPVSFATENHRISLLGNRLYFDDQELEDQADQLLGAVEIKDSIVVATSAGILLFDQDGELIEKLSGAEGVPAGMQKIGLSPENDLVVQAAHGAYLADLGSLSWDEKPIAETVWSESSVIQESLKTSLSKAYRGKGLSIERVLLDLHSGRILGSFGVFLMDAAAILFIILAITGVWMWSRVRRR